MRDHRSAGARGDDNVVGCAEDVQEMAGNFAGVVGISTIKGGLAAAGLSCGEVDLVAQALQHFCHGDSDFWKNLIDDARDE